MVEGMMIGFPDMLSLFHHYKQLAKLSKEIKKSKGTTELKQI
jgi:hypothetical protein